MSSGEVYETFLRALERYGFGIVLATAILWFVRTDLVIPMVKAHESFLNEMARTQHDISTALREQTRLLYAIRSKADDASFTTSTEVPDSGRN